MNLDPIFQGFGLVAQSVEQRPFKPLVAGSSPAQPTTYRTRKILRDSSTRAGTAFLRPTGAQRSAIAESFNITRSGFGSNKPARLERGEATVSPSRPGAAVAHAGRMFTTLKSSPLLTVSASTLLTFRLLRFVHLLDATATGAWFAAHPPRPPRPARAQNGRPRPHRARH